MPRRRKRRMKELLTEELLQQLLQSSDVKSFTDKHIKEKRSLPNYLQYLLDEKGLTRIEVIHEAGLGETYGYQIFMGQRKNPSRNKLIQLIFAMKLNLREANRLLKVGGVNELYCKNRRDAIIIFSLEKGYSLQKTDEELYRFNESTICDENH